MKTLFDFVSQTKGIEYLLAICFIAMYALLAEYMKKKPFAGLLSSIREDVHYIKAEGKADFGKLMKNAVKLPFVAGAYLLALPFYMVVGLTLKAEQGLASVAGGGSMAWRPLESYLTGRKIKRRKKAERPEKDEDTK